MNVEIDILYRIALETSCPLGLRPHEWGTRFAHKKIIQLEYECIRTCAIILSNLGVAYQKLGEAENSNMHHPATMYLHKTLDESYGTRLVPIIYDTILPGLLTSESQRFAHSYNTYQ